METHMTLWTVCTIFMTCVHMAKSFPQSRKAVVETTSKSNVPAHLQSIVPEGQGIEGHMLEGLVMEHMLNILRQAATSSATGDTNDASTSSSGVEKTLRQRSRTQQNDTKPRSNNTKSSSNQPETNKSKRISRFGRRTRNNSKSPFKSFSSSRVTKIKESGDKIRNEDIPHLQDRNRDSTSTSSALKRVTLKATNKKSIPSHFVSQTHSYIKNSQSKSRRPSEERQKLNLVENVETISKQQQNPSKPTATKSMYSTNKKVFTQSNEKLKKEEDEYRSIDNDDSDAPAHPAFIILNSYSKSRPSNYRSRYNKGKGIGSDQFSLFLPFLKTSEEDEAKISSLDISELLVNDEGVPYQFRFENLNKELSGFVTNLNKESSKDVITKLSKTILEDSDEDDSSSSSEEDDDDDDDDDSDHNSRFTSLNFRDMYNNQYSTSSNNEANNNSDNRGSMFSSISRSSSLGNNRRTVGLIKERISKKPNLDTQRESSQVSESKPVKSFRTEEDIENKRQETRKGTSTTQLIPIIGRPIVVSKKEKSSDPSVSTHRKEAADRSAKILSTNEENETEQPETQVQAKPEVTIKGQTLNEESTTELNPKIQSSNVGSRNEKPSSSASSTNKKEPEQRSASKSVKKTSDPSESKSKIKSSNSPVEFPLSDTIQTPTGTINLDSLPKFTLPNLLFSPKGISLTSLRLGQPVQIVSLTKQ